MKIKILGAGWYGCHIARALKKLGGVSVTVHEKTNKIMGGASGNIPARLHIGPHYPRSHITRAACREHYKAFMAEYGFLTRGIPVNLYAVADAESFVDFPQYLQTLRGEIELIEVHDPAEYGLQNVEGAILCAERHILADKARDFFANELGHQFRFESNGKDEPADWTIDCTFAANSAAGVDRYEPCLVPLLQGPTDRAVTIMDGPFPSLYPWDEYQGLCSLSSARWTPFSKTIRTWDEARRFLDELEPEAITRQAYEMFESMAHFYPSIRDSHEIVGHRLSIRAMPKSAADTRLVDVRQDAARLIRVRAGKIDAVIHAEEMIREILNVG